MSPLTHNQARNGRVSLVVFLGLVTALIAVSGYLMAIRRSASRDAAGLEATRNDLQAIADRLAAEQKQAERDRQVVLGVLRQGRSAADIPHFGGNRIVASRQDFAKLSVYVPEGSHTLVISSRWKRIPGPDQAADGNAVEESSRGEKTWRVPLHGSSGYVMELIMDDREAAIHWKLTSTDPEFDAQTEL